ncbi:MAG: Spy/CpxP family protein refolding chaperone [Planctomycetota bacterium]
MHHIHKKIGTVWAAAAAVGFLGIGSALAEPGNGDKGERPQRSADSGERGERGGPSAGERRGPGGPGGERRGGRDALRLLFRDIQLTDSQREEVREKMTQARDERRAWMEANGAELRELRERFQDARSIEDTDAMQAIGQELRTMMSAGPQPMDVAEDVRGMLTEEQAEQFDANLAELETRMEQRRNEARQNAGSGGPGGERAERGERGAGRDGDRPGRGGAEGRSGRGGPEGKDGQGKARGDGDGVDREAIEQRLREFRERREAERNAPPPVMDDDDFTDEPAGSGSDNGEQLDL